MKHTKKLLSVLLAGILLLAGCNTNVNEGKETEGTTETSFSSDILEVTPVKHEISIEEVESILIANGLQTNINRQGNSGVYHGGQQMRICRTERGVYVAFCKGMEDKSFYVAKIAPDNTVRVVHCGEFAQDGTISVNIAQDINGDIVVSSSNDERLFVYILDKDTDEVTEYSAPRVFASAEETYMGYAQTMFDFANRKLYVFFNGGLVTENYEMEWFTFDLETKTWVDGSICHSIEGIFRHAYLFPFPDGNGGAYIIGERDLYISAIPEQLKCSVDATYLWDELKLFHIPDLTSNENITYTTIQEAYSERGLEGVWSTATNNQHGGAFMDANGYLHITYMFCLGNYSGQYIDYDSSLKYYHAIYDGMECIFNEKLELNTENCKPQIVQSADGTLFMLVMNRKTNPTTIDIYKAEDALGKTWHLEATKTMPEGFNANTAPSFSTSEMRNGSVQDNIISCFFYYYNGVNTGVSFDLSLEDYSMTEVVDLLAGYDLTIDDRLDKRAHNSAHQTKVIHTENAAYAAFVNNYNAANKTEYFQIVKIDKDNNVTVLYSGEYKSDQTGYLTMQRTASGDIYVCPPVGAEIYHINQETDEVTGVTIYTPARTLDEFRQVEFLPATEAGNAVALVFKNDDAFVLSGYPYNPEDMSLNRIKKSFDMDLRRSVDDSIRYGIETESINLANYRYPYILDDGNGGAYVVLTREVDKEFLREKLQYAGYIHEFNDSIALLHIPNLGETNVAYTEVQSPYEAQGSEGIWSVVNIADAGDVYLDSTGKLHILYTYYHYDFDDMERREKNPLDTSTIKHYHAVYDGTTLVSNEEIGIAGLTKDTSVRMAETTDGTLYLLICNIGEAEARIDVYFETEKGLALAQTKTLGEFVAESFSISGPRGGSVQDNVIDCIVYANDNDVYFTSVVFE